VAVVEVSVCGRAAAEEDTNIEAAVKEEIDVERRRWRWRRSA
jgi:hypothetical protein